jgi:hypothetical protein
MCSTTNDAAWNQVEVEGLSPQAGDLVDPERDGLPRRGVLAGMASLPIFAMLPQSGSRVSGAAAAGVVRSALHVHTSFSEGSSGLKNLASTTTLASMESQVAALAALGADLCFFTDHDHRMGGHHVGMTIKPYPGTEDMTRPHWTYVPDRTASATGGTTAMTTRGLEASVTAGTAPAWRGMFVDCFPTDRDYRTTMAGMSLAFTLVHLSSGGWTEVRLRASHHPARSGRPAGTYEVHYRFSPTAKTRSVAAQGLAAVVTIPIQPNQSIRSLLTPVTDLRAAFPDLGNLASDNGLYGVWIGAGAPAAGSAKTLVTTMQVTRSLNGAGALSLQHSLMSDLKTLYPSVALGPGLEASYSTHLNLFSPTPSGLTYQPPQPGETKTAYFTRLVRTIHAAGGVASFNHPFGASIGTPLTGTARANLLATVAKQLLANRLYGCEVLEVGYELRGSMDVTGHLDLWDILLSAGIHVMADGVSDDHAGTVSSWTGGTNHYFTDIISSSSDPAQVTPLLGRGRAFVSLRTGFAGMLDLVCDAVRMGGTRTASGTTADVTIIANGLPTNGKLRVQQIRIHGDTTRVTPPARTTDVALDAATLGTGQVTIRVPNVRSYVRAEVLNSTGTRVAFSNPLWLTPPA